MTMKFCSTKAALLCFFLATATNCVGGTIGTVGECSPTLDCDFDSQCATGLLCADVHDAELKARNCDVKKAYCGNVGAVNFEVCYDPNKLGQCNGPLPISNTPGSPYGSGSVQECQSDCDLDTDCAPGLLCADAHTEDLKKLGLHERTAYCTVPEDFPAFFEVCYRPFGNEGVAGGDPHFRTYDGTMYSYHGACDLVMARGTYLASGGLHVDVHIRTEIIAGWSLISNAAIRIDEDVFELGNDGGYLFNGLENVELPLQLASRYEVTKTERLIEGSGSETEEATNNVETIFNIQLEGQDNIRLTIFKTMISVTVNAPLAGSEGMLGIHGKPGLVGRDHSIVYEDPNLMGAAWQVRDSEPMLFQHAREPQFPAECILPTINSRRLRQKENHRRLAAEACLNVPKAMRDFCHEDVMLTGDKDMAYTYGNVF